MSRREDQALLRQKVTWVEVKKKETLEERKRLRQRIVQTRLKDPSKKSKDDAFLGIQNQLVDRETVSLKREVKGQAKNSPATPARPPSQVAENKSRELEAPSERIKGLAKLGLALPLFATPEEKREELKPNWVNPSNVEAQDYVQGLKESDQTALNTKEYIFYSYFQRIRERLDRAWVPILQARLKVYFKAGRNLASDMNHTTQVMVYLNTKGEVIRVQLVSESGTKDLDEAAVNAFNEAGPFPNPPQGLVDSTGLIKIAWDFVLKT